MSFTQNGKVRETIFLLAGFISTAVMLTLAQSPTNIWPLAWVAYVPFILVCLPKSFTAENAPCLLLAGAGETTEKKNNFKKKDSDTLFYLIAYVVGAGFWLGNLYWMSFVTVSGWIAFCLYTAILWPILAMGLRWCINKKIPLIVATPILVVGLEQSQGLFLGGFYWHHLAHSQYANTTLIQIADIFGAAGVSFLVAMVNGTIADVIRLRQMNPPINWGAKHIFSILLVVAAIAGAIGYGKWRINEAEKFITTGPLIGAVQTNVTQSVKQSFAAEEEILDELLKNNKQCTAAGAKLIVWPETMVQAMLEPRVLRLLGDSHQYKLFDRAIREQARKGSYILAGAYGGNPRVEDNFDIRMAQKYNTAFFYKPDGNQAGEKYAKIHLVPFGEILPFSNIPLIHKLFLKMSPYDFDYTIDPGTEYTVFEMQPQGINHTYRFSVMICYEDAVVDIARHFVMDENGRKRIDWLVNISNDGWFVRFKNDRVLPSTELVQHTAICTFRAVENRLAVIRSVNTGISCMIDTLGRIKDGYQAGNLPMKAFERQGVGGWFADTVPIDSRITFFSKHGQWLDLSCQLCVAGIIIAQLAERFMKRKAAKLK